MWSSRVMPLMRRVIRALFGTNEPGYVAAAIAAAFVWGYAIVFVGDRPMPLWQKARDGLAISLLLMPFLLMGVARAARFMPRRVALATMTAVGLAAVLGHLLVAAGVTSPLIKAGVVLGFIAAAFLMARWLEKRNAMRASR